MGLFKRAVMGAAAGAVGLALVFGTAGCGAEGAAQVMQGALTAAGFENVSVQADTETGSPKTVMVTPTPAPVKSTNRAGQVVKVTPTTKPTPTPSVVKSTYQVLEAVVTLPALQERGCAVEIEALASNPTDLAFDEVVLPGNQRVDVPEESRHPVTADAIMAYLGQHHAASCIVGQATPAP